ncbi:MAG: hypothetical protein EA374_06565 [Acholeplasmatales bacterium]|nr:MAG: hypothetical protein EA374_06565 [Acholeplasmatales bacterium]
MKITVHNTTVPMMIAWLKDHQSGQASATQLDSILAHPDYAFEFERYGDAVPKEAFKALLLNLPEVYEDARNLVHLRMRAQPLHDFYKRLDTYKAQLPLIEIPEHIIDAQTRLARAGLPDDIGIEHVQIIITLGIGASFGYVHGHHVHFDFLQLAKEKSAAEFQASLAHEIHHVGFNHLLNPSYLQTLSLEALFYLYFSGEGLAVKYCNNAEGVLSKALYGGPKNIGLDPFTWRYLNDDFDKTFKHFKATRKAIKDGHFTREDFQTDLRTYWMHPYTDQRDTNDTPDLKQFRLYSLGNDLWGVIHDAFGKEKVYATLRNLDTFPDVFNAAVSHIGKPAYRLDVD